MEARHGEEEASLRLLREGFTLMGIRVYEALLAIRYLRQRVESNRNTSPSLARFTHL